MGRYGCLGERRLLHAVLVQRPDIGQPARSDGGPFARQFEDTEMTGLSRQRLALGLGFLAATHFALSDDTKTVTIFEGREMSVPVPAKWSFEERQDPHHST